MVASAYALRRARELGYAGAVPIETAVERLVESGEPRFGIGRFDRVYRLDERFDVRVRDVGGRTGGGRRKLELVGVVDVLRPPGDESFDWLYQDGASGDRPPATPGSSGDGGAVLFGSLVFMALFRFLWR